MDKAGVGASVGEFEKFFEDMDVKTGELDMLMEGMYAASIEQSEVNTLIQEVQSEQGMQIGGGLGVGTGAGQVDVGNKAGENAKPDDMQARLDQMNNL